LGNVFVLKTLINYQTVKSNFIISFLIGLKIGLKQKQRILSNFSPIFKIKICQKFQISPPGSSFKFLTDLIDVFII
jgi:hypothetical protein